MLARTLLYRKLPPAVRSGVDEAILLRPPGCGSLGAIDKRFQLRPRYGISPAALRTYARRLEQIIRPAVTSYLVGTLLGCLPESHRRQLVAGSQVLLLSKVVQALSARGEGDAILSVADLAKLASVLSSVSGRLAAERGPSCDSDLRRDGGHGEGDPTASPDTAKLAESVRMLYGLSWPTHRETDQGQQVSS